MAARGGDDPDPQVGSDAPDASASGASGVSGPRRSRSAAAPVTAVAGAVAATLLVVLLATWAASSGGDPVFRGDGLRLPTPSETIESPSTAAADDGSEGAGDDELTGPEETPLWVQALWLLVMLASAAVVVLLMFRAWQAGRRRWSARRLPPGPDNDPGFEVVDAPGRARAAHAITADSETQLAVLEEGAPRNGIVACWHRFELQAAAAGIVRESWETSSEFTLRMLDVADAEPRAVADLAALYREARFSDHALDESARARARAALTAIQARAHR